MPDPTPKHDPECTCGEPLTGHLLWCDALRGRPEYRPRKPGEPKQTRCACAAEGGCHCLDYEPHEHCTCSPCEATIAPARAAALALSAQAGEEAHNRERARWGLAPVVVA